MTPEESDRFYNTEYRSGLTTDMPTDEILAGFLTSGFRNTKKDFQRYIRLLHALGAKPGARILDFGCSWGYGSWQLQKAGFDVVGFEIARDRAAYAREKLSIPVVSELSQLTGMFDLVFSAHVIEHVPTVQNTLDFCMGKLSPRGQLVAITPNGSKEFRMRKQDQWNRMWGLKHPNFLDSEFYQHLFAGKRYFLTSAVSDYEACAEWRRRQDSIVGDLSHWELLAVCERN